MKKAGLFTINHQSPQDRFDELITRWNELNCQPLNISFVIFLTKEIEKLYKTEMVSLSVPVNVYRADGNTYSLDLMKQSTRGIRLKIQYFDDHE